jgi:protein phosphatase
MGATLSLCWFTPGWLHFGHIGDSRIYYLPVTGGIRQISEDDTHVGWLFRTGVLNERQAKSHPRRNLLQKALGAGHQFVSPQIGSVGYEPGDCFLLCSDGVTDGLFNDQLLRIVAETPSGMTSAQHIVNEAINHSGRDNTTAVIVAIGENLDEHLLNKGIDNHKF